MNDLTRCPDPDHLITLLYDDEGEDAERAALAAHVRGCRTCADVVAALDGTRGTLGAWRAPRLPLGFAAIHPRPPAWRQVLPWAGIAAGAVLTLAAAAGLAGLEVRYDDRGFAVRAGRPGPPSLAPAVTARQPESAPTATTAAAADPRTAWVTRAAQGEPPWRADLDLLATHLRAEFEARTHAAETRLAQVAASSASVALAPIDEERLVQRLAAQIEQSEVRQQQNLALRVAELGREFQLRRQADLVQFEQGLARVEQQRRDLIRRVAVSQAPQP
jgi:hypothetical protein